MGVTQASVAVATSISSSHGREVQATWDLKRLRAATRAAGVGMWSWNVDTDAITMDDAAHRLWGAAIGPTVTFETLSAYIHPSDLLRVRTAFTATRAIVGSYEVDFRILSDDKIRWISIRGEGNDAHIDERMMFGIFLDVTQRKQAEEAHELLAGEMSHRVKNLLAIASALTRITSRGAETAEGMARDLVQRLAALGRAHDFVRLRGGETAGALLGDLLSILLAPYEDLKAHQGRIRVSVPKLAVGEAAATTLALAVHELATNSVKYGALSVEDGLIDVAATIDEASIVVKWSEQGGPPVTPPGNGAGFGSTMVTRGITLQLGGSIDYNWAATGLLVTLRLDRDRLAA